MVSGEGLHRTPTWNVWMVGGGLGGSEGELKPIKICIRSSQLIGPAALMQPRFQLIWSFQAGEGQGRPGGRAGGVYELGGGETCHISDI